MFSIKVGSMVFLSTIIPTSYFMRLIFGGMYGTFFKQFPPAVFLSVNLLITLLIPLIITLFFIKKTDLVNRLPKPIPSQGIFLLCSVIILLPQVLRIFTSMIEGGGASFALMNLAAPFITGAKIVLYLAVIRLLMAVKPHEKYVYQ
jgi:hypothetical protein